MDSSDLGVGGHVRKFLGSFANLLVTETKVTAQYWRTKTEWRKSAM